MMSRGLVRAAGVAMVVACAGVAAAQVEKAWVLRYDGPGTGNDSPRDAVVSSDGSIYVTGQMWIGENERYGAGTIKIDPDGEVVWARFFDHMGNSDLGSSIAMDADENLYVFGFADSASSIPNGRDFLLIKYDSDGNEQWVRIDDGGFNLEERPRRVVVSPDGGVYVGGSVSTSTNIFDFEYLAARYSSSGELEWMRRYNGPGDGQDQIEDLAADSQGNLIVTGRSPGASGDRDIATIKYAPDGTELWVRRYTGPAGGGDTGNGIVVDEEDNIYVVGTSAGVATGDDAVVLKYDPDGKLVWEGRYTGVIDADTTGRHIALGPDGSVYIAGATDSGQAGNNIYGARFDTEGELLWADASFTGPLQDNDSANDIVVDSDGRLFIAGTVRAPGSGSPFFSIFDQATLSYSADGELLWAELYDGPVNQGEFTKAIAVDESRRAVYSVSESYGGDFSAGMPGYEYAIVRYDYEADPPCIADWNGDGEVDINDFFAYLSDFEDGDPRADLNNDGEIDINDFFIFLQEFEAGC